MAEATLTRTKQLKPPYPHQALIKSIEGWVEIGYTVTAAGKIVDAQALKSNPAGVFEAAGLDAVNHLRYQPFVKDGKPTAVTTKIRVAFRLSGRVTLGRAQSYSKAPKAVIRMSPLRTGVTTSAAAPYQSPMLDRARRTRSPPAPRGAGASRAAHAGCRQA